VHRQFCHDPKRLSVAFEAVRVTILGHQLVQNVFAGVPEGSVSKIMSEACGFNYLRINVETEASSGWRRLMCSANLRPTWATSMCQSGVKDVRFTGSDDLCDATKPTEGRAVQDAVSISFEFFSLIPLGNAMAAFSPSFRRWGRHPCLPLRPEDLQVLANHDVTPIQRDAERCLYIFLWDVTFLANRSDHIPSGNAATLFSTNVTTSFLSSLGMVCSSCRWRPLVGRGRTVRGTRFLPHEFQFHNPSP
jgi:hypothetical protein